MIYYAKINSLDRQKFLPFMIAELVIPNSILKGKWGEDERGVAASGNQLF